MRENKYILPSIVDITSPGYQAKLGKYFIGQTGELQFGEGSYAWGGLVNPVDSGVNLYFDIFTITNFSDQSYLAKIWMNALPPRYSRVSDTVTPSNQSMNPPPRPKAFVKYVDSFKDSFRRGVNIFDRIVPADSTLVSDSHQGSMIIGPGGTFSILLMTDRSPLIKGTIVLTWWEEGLKERQG